MALGNIDVRLMDTNKCIKLAGLKPKDGCLCTEAQQLFLVDANKCIKNAGLKPKIDSRVVIYLGGSGLSYFETDCMHVL